MNIIGHAFQKDVKEVDGANYLSRRERALRQFGTPFGILCVFFNIFPTIMRSVGGKEVLLVSCVLEVFIIISVRYFVLITDGRQSPFR